MKTQLQLPSTLPYSISSSCREKAEHDFHMTFQYMILYSSSYNLNPQEYIIVQNSYNIVYYMTMPTCQLLIKIPYYMHYLINHSPTPNYLGRWATTIPFH